MTLGGTKGHSLFIRRRLGLTIYNFRLGDDLHCYHSFYICSKTTYRHDLFIFKYLLCNKTNFGLEERNFTPSGRMNIITK